MRATSSGTSDKLVGEIVELSASAPAISGDYVRADGQVLSKAEWPLIVTTPDPASEPMAASTCNAMPGGGPGSSGSTNASQLTTTVDGSFVAIGLNAFATGSPTYSHSLWKSIDGISWKQTKYWENNATDTHAKLLLVNNILFFCSMTEGLMRSNDNGDTWESVTEMPCSGIAYGSSTYVICNQTATGYYSADLVTWTKFTYTYAAYNVFYVGAKFFASQGQDVATACNSTDGITWASVTLPLNHSGNRAKMVNGYVILMRNTASTASFMYSNDGITFIASAMIMSGTSSYYLTDVVYDGTNYVFVVNQNSSSSTFIRKIASLAGASTDIVIDSMFNADTMPCIGYSTNKCVILFSYTKVNGDSFLYFDTAFPSATVVSSTSTALYPIPNLSLIKQTLSGKKYCITRWRRPAYSYSVGLLLENAAGYLQPVKASNNSYTLGTCSGVNENTTGVAYYDIALNKWTVLWGLASSTDWAYSVSNYSGTTWLETTTMATLTSTTTSEFETIYGLAAIVSDATGTCYFIAKNQSSAKSTTSINNGTNPNTCVSASYDGTIVISGVATSFLSAFSFDGGETWPIARLNPTFINASGATVTTAQHYIVRLCGVFYVSMSNVIYACPNNSAKVFREVVGVGSAYGFDLASSHYEYAPNRSVGIFNNISMSGSVLNVTKTNAASLVYTSCTTPHRVGEWLIYGDGSGYSTIAHYAIRTKLTYNQDTQFSAPIIRPTNPGKVPYVKGR